MSKKSLPKGFKCECGTFHEFTVYVYAHWTMPLTHDSCPCGRIHSVCEGKARLIGRKSKEAK